MDRKRDQLIDSTSDRLMGAIESVRNSERLAHLTDTGQERLAELADKGSKQLAQIRDRLQADTASARLQDAGATLQGKIADSKALDTMGDALRTAGDRAKTLADAGVAAVVGVVTSNKTQDTLAGLQDTAQETATRAKKAADAGAALVLSKLAFDKVRDNGEEMMDQVQTTAENLQNQAAAIAGAGKRGILGKVSMGRKTMMDKIEQASESAAEGATLDKRQLKMQKKLAKAQDLAKDQLVEAQRNTEDMTHNISKATEIGLAALAAKAAADRRAMEKARKRTEKTLTKAQARQEKLTRRAEKVATEKVQRAAEKARRQAGRGTGMPRGGWLVPMAAGAGVMYFFDPQEGDRRRAMLRDQFTHLTSQADDTMDTATRDLSSRTRGIMTQVRQGDLQGVANRVQSEFRRENWAPGFRLVTALAGAFLALTGLRSGGLFGAARSAVGVGLVARSVSNKPLMTLVGSGDQTSMMDFHKTITVNAPVNEVFDFWRNYQNFPRFMSHLLEVRDLSNGRSHWVAEGPAGTRWEWDAVTTKMIPGEALAWRSEAGSTVGNAGIVHFAPAPNGGTQIDVHMSYNPPGGVVGHAVAAFFGSDPQHALDEDLQRFKSLIETGKTTTSKPGSGSQTVSKEEVSPHKGL